MCATMPSDEDAYIWLSQKYGINSKDYSKDIENPDYRTGLYELNGTKIQEMSASTTTVGIFMTVEKNFTYDDGRSLTIRGLGIFNTFFPMEDDKLWGLLN